MFASHVSVQNVICLCFIVTVVAFLPFCFFMHAICVHSQRTFSWVRLFANLTQVFNILMRSQSMLF